MNITSKLLGLTNASDCHEYLSLSVIASPLLNIKHMHRVPLFKDKKECGTTMPFVLYVGFKLRYIESLLASKMDVPENIDSAIHETLRRLLSDIFNMTNKCGLSGETMISKTFQEKIFRHVVWGESMVITEADLLANNGVNGAHTVSGSRCPSCTIPGFLCRWLLEKDGLNVASPFVGINSYVKRVGREVVELMQGVDDDSVKGGFSRRVQNRLMLQAFESSMSKKLLGMPIANPERKG
jgi:hypothetical protein